MSTLTRVHMTREDEFSALYRAHIRSVIAYFRRFKFTLEEARDLAQEVFVRVYRRMGSWQEEAEWAYLKKTAFHVALNELRRRDAQSRTAHEQSLDQMAAAPEDRSLWETRSSSPESELIDYQEEHLHRRRLHEAIRSLPERLQSCLLLWLGGLKYREIAKVLGITLDTAKTRIHEAKGLLALKIGSPPPSISDRQPGYEEPS